MTLSPQTDKTGSNPTSPVVTATIPAEFPPTPSSTPAPTPTPPAIALADRAGPAAGAPHSGGVIIVETLGTVRFANNAEAVSDNDQQRLQRLVDEVVPRLAAMPESGLYLTGFLNAGEPAGLDQRRAERVRAELIRRGIPASRIQMAETVSAPRKDANARTVTIQLVPLR